MLDEPTLGLDLLYRRQFYDTLLNDYFDKERTILLTTHQVEEVENLFTDVIFINRGQVALSSSVEELGERYLQLTVSAGTWQRRRARSSPSTSARSSAASLCSSRAAPRRSSSPLGELRTPSIADLFVAKMQGTMKS